MAYSKKHQRLAEKIREIFKQEFILRDDVQQYISSTIGHPSVRMLKSIMEEDENCEKESLLELILFPDESIQVKVEDILLRENFEKEDEDKVLKILLDKEVTAVILYPDPPDKIAFPVDELCVSRFLSRLNISKAIDKKLVNAVNRHVENREQLLVKVKLRNARFVYTGHGIDFLCDFFEKYKTNNTHFFNHLDFILDFLQEHEEGQDIYSALMSKKSTCQRNIKEALRYQKQLEKYNIETLMLKGIRNQSINVDEMRITMDMIDSITMNIFR